MQLERPESKWRCSTARKPPGCVKNDGVPAARMLQEVKLSLRDFFNSPGDLFHVRFFMRDGRAAPKQPRGVADMAGVTVQHGSVKVLDECAGVTATGGA